MYNDPERKPFLIGVCGAHSGVGKTSVAAALLKHLTDKGQEPAKNAGQPGSLKRWGAIKYTKTALLTSIIEDSAVLCQQGKDTRRLMDAGAEEVIWVQSPPEDLHEVMPMAIDRLCHLEGIVIEGNSAIEFIKPHIVIFIFGASADRTKPSANLLIQYADILIVPRNSEGSSVAGDAMPADGGSHRLTFKIEHGPSPASCDSLLKIHELVGAMDKITRKKQIERSLREKAVDSKIQCGLARRIAEDLDVPYREVGDVANGLRIKIVGCELGCF
ncbi:MAG: hypothetical protein ACLPX5_10505 [Dissulfurispiraceae bacterium]